MKKLKIPAFAVEIFDQLRVLQKGENGDVLFGGEGEFHVQRTVVPRQEICGDGNDEKLHLPQVDEEVFVVARRGFLVVPDGTVLIGENLLCHLFQIKGVVCGMGAEIHAGLPLRGRLVSRFAGKFCHGAPPCALNSLRENVGAANFSQFFFIQFHSSSLHRTGNKFPSFLALVLF